MKIKTFLRQIDHDFFTGVPDSALRPLCDYLLAEKGISSEHVIAANEGNCVGLAAGTYLATGKVPIVYLQNSGIGNIINPVASLLNEEIYSIPCIFLVGWRGEPGTKDEPQHIFQGQVTCSLLQEVGINVFFIDRKTSEQDLKIMTQQASGNLKCGKQVAFVFRRESLSIEQKVSYQNSFSLSREDAIQKITEVSGSDVLVASTGKISRELFEIRERAGDIHCRDFLTVGSMGHTSSIALGIALKKCQTRVWCIEGDGSFLMHMGAVAVIGSITPANMVHIVLNNEAHESVGGMPTVMSRVDLCGIARSCGYDAVYSTDNLDELGSILKQIRIDRGLMFLEIKIAIGSREDLGRPSVTSNANKTQFMHYLASLEGEDGYKR